MHISLLIWYSMKVYRIDDIRQQPCHIYKKRIRPMDWLGDIDTRDGLTQASITINGANYLWPILLKWFNFNPSVDK